MIVPMKKVSLFTLGDQKEQTLRQLRRLGLVHIEISQGSGAKLEELNARIALLESAMFTLGDKVAKGAALPGATATAAEALSLARRVTELTEEQKTCRSEQGPIAAELERLRAWGKLDPKALASLCEQGVELSLIELPPAEYRALGESVFTIPLEKTRATVRAVALFRGGEDARESREALRPFCVALPKVSTEELARQLTALCDREAAIERELASYAVYLPAMKAAVAALGKEVLFETYATGMAEERLAAGETNVTLSYFVGFIEAEKLEVLREAAKEYGWGLVAEDPCEEDNAPTKLKNNKFVSLIYPLTDFLGTVPGYFEYDISAWFLGFILVFFGIIFGDGGYGLLICAIAAPLILKALWQKKPVPPVLLLIGLFGLSTIAWGALTCTWFGLSPELLPGWLRSISVPVISNVYADKIWYPPWTGGEAGLTTSQNVQILCFALAWVQLSVAHIKCAVRNRKSLKILGDIGSVLQLTGIFYLVLSLVVNGAVFGFGLVLGGIPVGTVAIGLIAVGFVLSFVFANFEGSILGSTLASLKDIVSVLLGVINVFSDIVSYIRLWAVGLAGAAISATVNELVSPFLGNLLLMVVAMVLLIFGHGLNMILNVLSVIVHGIRLNTLEFSSHLGMSWSGRKYEPFKE